MDGTEPVGTELVGADLPEEAYLLAMAALPGVGPAAMRKALERHAAPDALAVLGRDHPASVDPAAIWERHRAAGVMVVGERHSDYPVALRDDPDPPVVLVARGDLGALDRRRVGIVGTRRASQYGLGVAGELGRRLAASGLAVVSGLALGIDAAAHQGVLRSGSGPPVGVVATGLDVVYPPRHRRLWEEVAEAGVLLSEGPLGTQPDKWRFPARNRIIAGLSEAVVVVESKAVGGSLYTAEFALDRDRPLFAVPGPITSAAARGTNRLLVDGASPLTGPDDVLLELGIDPPTDRDDPAEPGGVAGRVLDATRHEVVTLETLVARSGLGLVEVAGAIQELCAAGWLVDHGGHYERGTPAPPASGA